MAIVFYLNKLIKVFTLMAGIILALCCMHSIALADDICLRQPIGSEVGVSGEEITIEWITENLSTAWAIDLFYRENDSSTLHNIGWSYKTHGGSFTWNLPVVTEKKEIQIIVRLVDEASHIVGHTESGFITVYTDSTSRSLYLVAPQPNPCNNDNNVTIQGGTEYLIEWEAHLCDSIDDPWLEISYSTNDGATYTYITHPITNPVMCTTGSYSWSVPVVDEELTNCKIRLEWSGQTATHVWPFTITPDVVNHPPIAEAGPPKSVVGRGCTSCSSVFDASWTDPEGGTLNFHWELLNPSEDYCVRITSAGSVNPQLCLDNTPVERELYFKLTVTDDGNPPKSHSDTVTVTVLTDMDEDGVADITDNCPTVPNPTQGDSDNDEVGNVCDNCPDDTNPDQTDTDGDGMGDSCDRCPLDALNDEDGDFLCANIDNCPSHWNIIQRNWDDDDKGNACDCDDWVTGANEYAADCGGICPNLCMRTHGCLPVFMNGDPDDKIDIVFVRADEYTDEGAFIQDAVMPIIWESFDEEFNLRENLDRYNFWVAEHDAAFWVKDDNGCGWIARWWRRDCPSADIAVVIHLRTCRDKSKGDTFSAEWNSYGTVRHELGHALFDLGDEYDDPDCSTNYHPAFPQRNSNIWRSEEKCIEHTTYPIAECSTEFTSCDLGYHKGNPGQSIMKAGEDCEPPYPGDTCGGWGNDAIRQLDYIHAMYSPSVAAAATTQSQSESLISENPKAMVVQLFFGDGAIQLQDLEILYGETPDRKIPYNGLKLSIKDSIGQVLSEFTIRDPRIEELDYPTGATFDNTNFEFSQVLQFFKNAVRLEISENESGVLLGEFDLASYISTFCSQFPEDEDCQCTDVEVCDSVDNNCDGQIDEAGYIFGEFMQPINPDGSSIFNAGRTIPVKLAVHTCSGATTSEAILKVLLEKVADEVTGTNEEFLLNYAESSNDASNYFRYDVVDKHYIYNLGTKGLDIGTYKVTAKAENGQSSSVLFSIK